MAHTCMAPPLSPPSSPSPLLPTSSLPQDSADSFSVTAKSTTDSDGKPLGRGRKLVPTTIDVLEADNGSCSVLKIQTLDRPGLLVDIVRGRCSKGHTEGEVSRDPPPQDHAQDHADLMPRAPRRRFEAALSVPLSSPSPPVLPDHSQCAHLITSLHCPA